MNNHSAPTWDGLCAVVEDTMAAKSIPGVAVGILSDGEMTVAGFGVTNVDHPLPVTDETFFQIGSITKTFTGTAIMRLVEAGKVDLDATVRTYVPEFRVADEAASSQATIRHLLTHTSGWAGDHFYDTGAGDDALAAYVTSMAGLTQVAPLGAHFSYNNAGFGLAGRVIEAVTGKRYGAALQEWVTNPLDLVDCFLDPGDVMTRRFAVGHRVKEGGAQVARPWPLPRSIDPVGGIICHVKDLLRYARFHLGDGGTEDGTRLLSPESMRAMQSRQVTIWDGEYWGLSWSIRDFGGVRMVGHGGSTVGQTTTLALLPEHNFAIAVLTNADRGGAVTREATRWALKQYLGVEWEEPTQIEATQDELAQYAGWYRRPFSDIELGMLGGRLVGQMVIKQGFPSQKEPPLPPPPPVVLGLCEKDRLLVLDGPGQGDTAEIVRNADGSIGWMRLGRLYRRDA